MPLGIPKKLQAALAREARAAHGLRLSFLPISGTNRGPNDPLARLAAVRRARTIALHESVTRGEAGRFAPLPSLQAGVIPVESDRTIRGALLVGEALTAGPGNPRREAEQGLVQAGLTRREAARITRRLPLLDPAVFASIVRALADSFYQASRWRTPVLEENRLRTGRQRQIAEALAAQERSAGQPVYPFEKERILLSFIKAGDRTEAMRVLNEMLAALYLTAPQLPVLRARTIELMGYLTRAAVEDSPALEPLIVRNHDWMARLIQAPDFETLSRVLMQALDEFIEGIFREGYGRGHPRVTRALEFIRVRHADAIALRDVAQAAGVSVFRIAHLVRRHTGKTVLQWILDARLAHARRLLETSAKSGAEIAAETGFGDQSAFIRRFRARLGATPGRFRRAHWAASGRTAGPPLT